MTLRTLVRADLRFDVWRRDGFRCIYCGLCALTDRITLENDHVIPVINGGRAEMSNLVTACRPCNRKKGAVRDRSRIEPRSVTALRLARRLTIAGLARKTGLSRVTVYAIERGESVSLETLVSVARALEIPLSDIAPDAARELEGVA